DRDLTWPPFFREQIAPWLRRVADRLHRAGKRLLTHTDGENEGLLPLYTECRFDVAESVCPAPMTRLTLRQLREGFGRGIAVWGGVPSVALLPESMDDAAFEAYVDQLFEQIGDGRHLILGVSDNVPPDADLERLARIGQRCAALGPVAPRP
ncbi:MAG: uroporphyrinogen decarboxylase family protein, partial [Gemmatimonadota bacterium]